MTPESPESTRREQIVEVIRTLPYGATDYTLADTFLALPDPEREALEARVEQLEQEREALEYRARDCVADRPGGSLNRFEVEAIFEQALADLWRAWRPCDPEEAVACERAIASYRSRMTAALTRVPGP